MLAVCQLSASCLHGVRDSEAQQLPDTFVDNPGGSQAIFYLSRGFHNQWPSEHKGPAPEAPPLPPDSDARPHPKAGELLPRVDRFEELLQWAEAQAAANGINPPYLRDGFVPASVMPPRASAGEGASSSDPPELDLPPLQAEHMDMDMDMDMDTDM